MFFDVKGIRSLLGFYDMDKKIRRFCVNKLVRDNLEHIFRQSGAVAVYKRVLNDAEFDENLRRKVLEEAHEVVSSKKTEELIDECADLVEVLEAIILFHGKTWDDVATARANKSATRGVFKTRLFIESVDLPSGSELADYYIAHPEKYQELPIE